ncbi:hypothetical protein FVE85_3929 [Porphyridium purpureum]|uniref:ER membrane protein complex subunit 6 n=1 Tax=Porphyridium purpureum TaxID=35688 RepID=A0A5J4YTD0_PORPP|nr:hypothetical protein FVE85_3929 [Porphyridium purpureum]|eukprot:POR3637..scf229_5
MDPLMGGAGGIDALSLQSGTSALHNHHPLSHGSRSALQQEEQQLEQTQQRDGRNSASVVFQAGRVRNDAFNLRSIHTLRSHASIYGGVICGLLGLQSWQGLLFYVLSALLQALAIYICLCRARPSTYLLSPTRSLLFYGVADRDILLSFLLFWTFTNALHIF